MSLWRVFTHNPPVLFTWSCAGCRLQSSTPPCTFPDCNVNNSWAEKKKASERFSGSCSEQNWLLKGQELRSGQVCSDWSEANWSLWFSWLFFLMSLFFRLCNFFIHSAHVWEFLLLTFSISSSKMENVVALLPEFITKSSSFAVFSSFSSLSSNLQTFEA